MNLNAEIEYIYEQLSKVWEALTERIEVEAALCNAILDLQNRVKQLEETNKEDH